MDEICQCCGMILKTSDDMGRFADGTVNSDYCRFCFSDGGFTHATMDEQIQCNLQHLEEWRLEKEIDISRDEAEIQLREYLPQLKRWLPVEKKTSWILERCGYVVLSTSHMGFPRPIAMDVLLSEGIRRLWMTADSNSVKVCDLRADDKAGVCIVRNGDNITLIGHAYVHDDRETKERFWDDRLTAYFPDGIGDRGYCIIEFVADEAMIWIDGESGTIDPRFEVSVSPDKSHRCCTS